LLVANGVSFVTTVVDLDGQPEFLADFLVQCGKLEVLKWLHDRGMLLADPQVGFSITPSRDPSVFVAAAKANNGPAFDYLTQIGFRLAPRRSCRAAGKSAIMFAARSSTIEFL
jgi:hypothetical protein